MLLSYTLHTLNIVFDSNYYFFRALAVVGLDDNPVAGDVKNAAEITVWITDSDHLKLPVRQPDDGSFVRRRNF